ncbi:MATE family efflux transporter [Teredinibacter waterburyi]|jgi:putative efflux protein, MATE family|uniref:MATE family efflux transporter n=1 Tax=Teredinibacter waterburyi TaxID=1500538 RepID=UPI00165FD7EC|nr:MATE family efflux transporter [Teredinibacter waterburyi]
MWGSVALLALPVALQMMLQSLLGMADVLMVGELGPVAIAAVGLSAKLHFLLLVMMAGIGAGASVLVAQYSGAGNLAATQRTLALAVMVGVASMIPFTLLFLLGGETVVSLINPDPEVVALTASYLRITAFVVLLTLLSVVFESGLRAMGNTGLPLLMGAIATAANVVLNYALIFGHWGMPAMGVEGAAWATLIARGIQLAGILLWLYLRSHHFALRLQHFKAALDKDALLRFTRFATPLVINHVIWAVGNATYHVMTGYAGTEALAVMGVIVPIESLFFSLFVGISNASTVLIGRALGGSQTDEAWRLHRFFDQLSFGLVVALSAGLWLSRHWVVAIFDQLDAATAELLTDTLAIFSLLIWVKVLNMIRILGVLRAGGDNRFCLITDTIVMWVIGIPIYTAAIFLGGFSFLTIYTLMYLEDVAKFIPVRHRIGVRRWMKNLTLT